MAEIGPKFFKEVKQITRADILLRISYQKSMQSVYVGSSDAKIYSVDPLADKPEFHEFQGHTSYVMGLVDTEKHLVSGSYDRSLIWWDKESREIVRRVEDAHDRWIRNIFLTPDGQTVLSVGDDMVCKLWDAKSGEFVRELVSHQKITPNHFPNMLYATAVSPDGNLIATVDRIAKIKIWDFKTGEEVTELEAPKCYTWDSEKRIHSIGGIRSVCFSPDSKSVAVGGIGPIGNIDHLESPGRVEIFNVASGEKTHEFEGDKNVIGLVEQIVFHPSGKWLMAVGGKHTGWVQFLDLEKKEVIRQVDAPMHVHQVAVTDDFGTVYGAGHGKLIVWSLVN
jgi:WD40 repeat protein